MPQDAAQRSLECAVFDAAMATAHEATNLLSSLSQPASAPATQSAARASTAAVDVLRGVVNTCSCPLVLKRKRSEKNAGEYLDGPHLEESASALTSEGVKRLAELCRKWHTQQNSGHGLLAEELNEVRDLIVGALNVVTTSSARAGLGVVYEALIGEKAPSRRCQASSPLATGIAPTQPPNEAQGVPLCTQTSAPKSMRPDVEDLLAVKVVQGKEKVAFYRGADLVCLPTGVSTRLFGVGEFAEKRVQAGDVDKTLQELPGLPDEGVHHVCSRQRSVVFVFSGEPATMLARSAASFPAESSSSLEVQETPGCVRVYVTPLNAARLAKALEGANGFKVWSKKGFELPPTTDVQMFVCCKEGQPPFGYEKLKELLENDRNQWDNQAISGPKSRGKLKHYHKHDLIDQEVQRRRKERALKRTEERKLSGQASPQTRESGHRCPSNSGWHGGSVHGGSAHSSSAHSSSGHDGGTHGGGGHGGARGGHITHRKGTGAAGKTTSTGNHANAEKREQLAQKRKEDYHLKLEEARMKEAPQILADDCQIAGQIQCPGNNFTVIDGKHICELVPHPTFTVCVTRTVKSSDTRQFTFIDEAKSRVKFYGKLSDRFMEFKRPVTHFFAVPDTVEERARSKRSFYGDIHFTISLDEYISQVRSKLGSIHIYKYCKRMFTAEVNIVFLVTSTPRDDLEEMENPNDLAKFCRKKLPSGLYFTVDLLTEVEDLEVVYKWREEVEHYTGVLFNHRSRGYRGCNKASHTTGSTVRFQLARNKCYFEAQAASASTDVGSPVDVEDLSADQREEHIQQNEHEDESCWVDEAQGKHMKRQRKAGSEQAGSDVDEDDEDNATQADGQVDERSRQLKSSEGNNARGGAKGCRCEGRDNSVERRAVQTGPPNSTSTAPDTQSTVPAASVAPTVPLSSVPAAAPIYESEASAVPLDLGDFFKKAEQQATPSAVDKEKREREAQAERERVLTPQIKQWNDYKRQLDQLVEEAKETMDKIVELIDPDGKGCWPEGLELIDCIDKWQTSSEQLVGEYCKKVDLLSKVTNEVHKHGCCKSPAVRYRCVKASVVRVGLELNSDIAHELPVGTEITALEIRDKLVRFSGGWVSVTCDSGQKLLKKLDEDLRQHIRRVAKHYVKSLGFSTTHEWTFPYRDNFETLYSLPLKSFAQQRHSASVIQKFLFPERAMSEIHPDRSLWTGDFARAAECFIRPLTLEPFALNRKGEKWNGTEAWGGQQIRKWVDLSDCTLRYHVFKTNMNNLTTEADRKKKRSREDDLH